MASVIFHEQLQCRNNGLLDIFQMNLPIFQYNYNSKNLGG